MRKRFAAAATAAVFCLVATAVAQHRPDSPRKKSVAPQVGRTKPRQPLFVPLPEPGKPLAQRLEESRLEALRYKGLDVVIQPGVDEATRRVQMAAARLLERLDYLPPHRVETFRHLTDSDSYTISAWHAEILSSHSNAEGVTLEVQVWCELGFSGASSAVHTIETYLYTTAGRIEHLGSLAPKVSGVMTTN